MAGTSPRTRAFYDAQSDSCGELRAALGANLFSYTYSNTRNNLDLSQGKCFALVQNALDR